MTLEAENPALVLLAVIPGASVRGGEGDGEGVDGEKGVSWVGRVSDRLGSSLSAVEE